MDKVKVFCPLWTPEQLAQQGIPDPPECPIINNSNDRNSI